MGWRRELPSETSRESTVDPSDPTLRPTVLAALALLARDGVGARVTTGKVLLDVDAPEFAWGWTADGVLFRASGDTLRTCDARSGDCTQRPLTPPMANDAEVRLGGVTYES